MATDGVTAQQRGKSIYAPLGAPMDLLQWKLVSLFHCNGEISNKRYSELVPSLSSLYDYMIT